MKDEKILVLGKGFIGARLQKVFNCPVSDKMLYTFEEVERETAKYNPKILINCAGMTGYPNVDACENKKQETLFANTFLPIILADICFRRKIKMVHISSGCIFHFDHKRDKPISEIKVPDYFDLFYSRSKIYAERALEVFCAKQKMLIVRIRIPLDNEPHPKNILNKLLSFRKVIDLPNSVTYLPDFDRAMRHLIRADAHGIYNVVNKGGLRYPELLDVYKKYKPGFEYEIVDYKKLGLNRTNMVMSTAKLEKAGFKVRKIQEVLNECVKNYVKYL